MEQWDTAYDVLQDSLCIIITKNFSMFYKEKSQNWASSLLTQ